jgi:beta-glucosidase
LDRLSTQRTISSIKSFGGALNKLILSLIFLFVVVQAIDAEEGSESQTDVLEELVIIEAGKESDFQMFLGDKKNWRLSVDSQGTNSANNSVRLQWDEMEQAQTVSWRGRGEGQFYLASTPQDLSSYDLANAALVMVVRVNQAPKKQVVLRMGCGYPCAGNADLTQLFKAVPLGQWLKVSIDLACYSTRGLNTKEVDTPFLLLTAGKFSLSVSDIRLIPNTAKTATVRCS